MLPKFIHFFYCFLRLKWTLQNPPEPKGTVDGYNHRGFSKTTTYAYTVIIVPVNPKTGSSGSVSFAWMFYALHLKPLSHAS